MPHSNMDSISNIQYLNTKSIPVRPSLVYNQLFCLTHLITDFRGGPGGSSSKTDIQRRNETSLSWNIATPVSKNSITQHHV